MYYLASITLECFCRINPLKQNSHVSPPFLLSHYWRLQGLNLLYSEPTHSKGEVCRDSRTHSIQNLYIYS